MGKKGILSKAKQLGIIIGKSKEWKDFKKAREEFKNDGNVQKLLKELKEKEKMQEEKLSKGIPVEVEEKREIKRLEEELSKNEIFMSFVECENRYLSLMEEIDKAIKEGTGEGEKE